MTAPIYSIPIEVFLDHLLPVIDVPDLLNLACTNKFFAKLCADDLFWKRKLKDDMNYSIADARNKGFKLLYRGIRRPRVYVWGSSSNGRLGMLGTNDLFGGSGAPFPIELPMKETRTVSIVAGGWSFATLDEEGSLHVWGQLDPDAFPANRDDLSGSSHIQRTPIKLIPPEPIVSISAGRRHLIGLDAKRQVWLFASWGRPALLRSHQISNPSSRTSRVIQVEAGWDHITVLTEAGHVFVEWPYDGILGEKIRSHHDNMREAPNRGQDTTIRSGADSLKCADWVVDQDFLELPSLPVDLPPLDHGVTGGTEINETGSDELRIVKIAAGRDFVVALTNQGHVVKMVIYADERDDLVDEFRRGTRKWKYLPEFSELERLKVSFEAKGVAPPASISITHISATFRTFTAYSVGETSVILLGNEDTDPSMPPNIIPGLQNQNIVSAVLGDYYFGALTQDGTMLTWGKYSDGALGLGARRESTEPTAVRFDYQDGKRDKFVFAIAASGWHTAALVIDMEPTAPPAYVE